MPQRNIYEEVKALPQSTEKFVPRNISGETIRFCSRVDIATRGSRMPENVRVGGEYGGFVDNAILYVINLTKNIRRVSR